MTDHTDATSDPVTAIELLMATEDAARLARLPALAPLRAGRPKKTSLLTVWHDSADRILTQSGLSLSETRGLWRLEQLRPGPASGQWLPATPAPVLAVTEALETLPDGVFDAVRGRLSPMAAFAGTRRDFPLSVQGKPARLSVIEGDLRGVVESRPVCRLLLAGAPRMMANLALELSEQLRLDVPLTSLGDEALALATGTPPPPRHQGGPKIVRGSSVSEALTSIIAHLADMILYWAPLVIVAKTEEPVHQMRVALRRLRSALSIFRRALDGNTAWLEHLAAELKTLSGLLGVARDWDVFLAGAGAEVTLACGEDPRLTQMLAAAGRRRDAAYDGLRAHLQGSAAWRRLALELGLLASLRPWESIAGGPTEHLNGSAESYAASALERRLKHVLGAGESLDGVVAAQLHEIRKQAKRLRYAIEFFVLLFPEKQVRRYLARLEELQEDFGAFNDAAVASGLAASLGGGTDRAFAAGTVHGFGAAAQLRARRHVAQAWRKFYRATPFWD